MRCQNLFWQFFLAFKNYCCRKIKGCHNWFVPFFSLVMSLYIVFTKFMFDPSEIVTVLATLLIAWFWNLGMQNSWSFVDRLWTEIWSVYFGNGNDRLWSIVLHSAHNWNLKYEVEISCNLLCFWWWLTDSYILFYVCFIYIS